MFKRVISVLCAFAIVFGVFAFDGCKKKSAKKQEQKPEEEEEIVVPVPEDIGPTTYARYSKNEDGTYTEDENGGYVAFGTYPVSIKEKSITINKTKSADGYWVGSDNLRYVKQGTKYYKVETIMWKILNIEDGKATLLCEQAIDRVYYNRYYEESNGEYYKSDSKKNFILDENDEKIFANNYEHSDLREYLNGTFLETAFTETQRALIATTTVDNSSETNTPDENPNPYACENTEDKVYVLSYQEAVALGENADRCRTASAYAQARGVHVYDNGNCLLWLRSPYFDDSYFASIVDDDGRVATYLSVNYDDGGVAPALQITLQ